MSGFLGVALGVALAEAAFLGVAAAFLALGAAVFFDFEAAAAVLAGRLVMRPELVLAVTLASSTTAGAFLKERELAFFLFSCFDFHCFFFLVVAR